MKLTTAHIDSLVRKVLTELEKKKLVEFNKGKDQILQKGREIIMADFAKEAELDEEIERMMDNIEKEQTDQFQRHRMFKMLKKKVAEERGIIL